MKEDYYQEYVVGFLFSEDEQEVALILKSKPDWQKGKYNGIGGKIEPGEHALFAMTCEFKEEAGMVILGWREFCVLYGTDYNVHFFTAKGDLKKLQSMTEEKVRVYFVNTLPMFIIPNLKWLIPMALDKDNLDGEVYENVSER